MWQLEAGSWTNILLMSSMWQFPKKQQRNTKPLTIAQSCTFLLSKKAKTWSPNQGSWLRWQNVCSANPHQSLNNTSLSVPKPQDMKCQNMYEAILSGYWLLCFFFNWGIWICLGLLYLGRLLVLLHGNFVFGWVRGCWISLLRIAILVIGMNIPYHQNSNAISYYIHPLLSILDLFWPPFGSELFGTHTLSHVTQM